jgi:HNH endonuclease
MSAHTTFVIVPDQAELLCLEPGCTRPVRCRDLCRAHYEFRRKRGTLPPPGPVRFPALPGLPAQEGVELRHCPRHPGCCVGDDGSVWSCNPLRRVVRWSEWRRLHQSLNGHGYLRVRLGMWGWVAVHRLVLEAFVGPCPPGLACCHADGDKTNNHPSNLRWDTYKANSEDMKRHGTWSHGEAIPWSRLTPEKVRSIRRLKAQGVTFTQLVEMFGIGRTTAQAVVSRRSWAHVNDDGPLWDERDTVSLE